MQFFRKSVVLTVFLVAGGVATVLYYCAYTERCWLKLVNPVELTTPSSTLSERTTLLYLEDGDTVTNLGTLRATLRSLMDMGWVDDRPIPSMYVIGSSLELWRWAGNNLESSYLVFESLPVESLNWRSWPANEDKFQRISDYLENHEGDPIVLAFGNRAGYLMAAEQSEARTLVINVNNPEHVGYTEGLRYSNQHHVHVSINKTKSVEQLRFFFSATQFKQLGVAYYDTIEGRADAGLVHINQLASEYGLEVLHCVIQHANSEHYPGNIPVDARDSSIGCDTVEECVDYLKDEVDAIYLAEQPNMTYTKFRELNAPVMRHNLPLFSQMGNQEVEWGALMSLSELSYAATGKFEAKVIGRAVNNEGLLSIPQYFSSDLSVFINEDTAKHIGYSVPGVISWVAGVIYPRYIYSRSAER